MLLNFSEQNLNLTFEVTDEGRLSLLSCSNTEYIPHDDIKKYAPAIEIQLTGGNQDDHHGAKHTVTSESTSLKYCSHEYYENDYGKKLEFTLENDSLRAVVHYQLYSGISALRSWSVIENISCENAEIEYVSSFTYTGIDAGDSMTANEKMSIYIPHNSWVRELAWRKYTLSELGFDKITNFSTKRINVSNTGTWSAKEYLPMGAAENSETGTVLMWQIENNGSWQWEIGDIADSLYLKLSGPTENENHWHKSLKPGEIFETVKTAVCVGEDFDTALSEMTAYRRKIVRPNQADSALPVIFNDYMNCLWADPTTEKMIPVIDKAAEAGAEYYCMDAGWYADGTWWETVGEWQPCEWRFPGGIKEVFDYIRYKDMIPGIWLEIEVMGINCPILSQFTDDCFFMRHGKRVIDHGRYQLDFRNPKVREFATSVIDRVVDDYGVGYIKMDYNIDGGSGTEINSDSFGDGLLEHNRAYVKWVEDMMDRYPELIIENCSSGGMRMDYALLGVHSIQSVSDQEDYRNNAVIAANCATGVLPEQGAIWSYPKADSDVNAAEFNMVNAMLTRLHLSGEIAGLSNEQFTAVKSGVECYKQIRSRITQFVPFYPLGLNRFNSPWACAGYRAGEEVYIALWRLDSADDTVTIPVDISNPCIIYPKHSNARAVTTPDGLRVTLKDKYSAVIISNRVI